MKPTKHTARIAGALYVLLGLTAPFSLMYVPATLFVRGNATATAGKILGSEMLFRLGMVNELMSSVICIFLVMTLYRLFNQVDKMQASLMVILSVVSAPITFLGVVLEIGALTAFRGADYLNVFSKAQLDALALFFIGLHGKGILANEIFWGLWLFPFGILVIRSGFLPRILGVLLIVNGFAYLAVSLTGLLVPEYSNVVERYALIAQFGEVWIMFWLLIRGPRAQPPLVPAEQFS